LGSPANWVCVPNLSGPAIDGELPTAPQNKCAEWYYKEFGYWDTAISASSTWAIVARL